MVWDIASGLPLLISDTTYTYIYGIGPIGMVDAQGNDYYFLRDGLGSVTGIVDGNGTLTATYSYDAYGNLRSSTGTLPNAFRYTGEWYDNETGFYYLRARYYDPAVGRFVTRDPWLGFLTRPYSLNPYLYAENNPVNWVDPSGEFAPLLILAAVIVTSPEVATVLAAGIVAMATIYLWLHQDEVKEFAEVCAALVQERADALGDWLAKKDRNPAQDTKLSDGEIKKLEKVGGAEGVKREIVGRENAGKYDLFKDRKGNVIVKPKNGKGPGEPTGYNLNDL